MLMLLLQLYNLSSKKNQIFYESAITFAVLPPATVTVSGNGKLEALFILRLSVVFSCV